MSTAARTALKAAPFLGCAAVALTSVTIAAPIVRGPIHPTIVRPVTHAIAGRRFAGSGVTLYGGGATLPALAYEGGQAFSTNPGVSPFASGTVFGQLLAGLDSGDNLQYCQTGSGYGKGVMNGSNPANGPCAAIGQSPTGFGIPTTAQNYADFSGSDAPASQSEYSALQTGPLSSRGEFVQVPYIAGAVAIFYNNSSLANVQLVITPATLCKIADGEINNWNQVPKNPTKPNGPFYPAKTLTWVYRYDGSGTTFSFGNYLSALTGSKPSHCTTQNYGLSQVYDANNNSKGASGGFGVLPNTAPEQANYLAGSGNQGVVGCILNETINGNPPACFHADAPANPVGDGSIGYVEAANAATFINKPLGQNYADLRVNTATGPVNYDPIKNLPAAAKQVKTVSVNLVVAAPLAAGRPVPDTVAVTGNVSGNCLGIVDPAAYDNIKNGYPILAVTNLEFTSAGNGVKVNDLRNLATFADAANFPKSGITTVDSDKATTGTTGYSQIGLSTTAITTLAGCIGT